MSNQHTMSDVRLRRGATQDAFPQKGQPHQMPLHGAAHVGFAVRVAIEFRHVPAEVLKGKGSVKTAVPSARPCIPHHVAKVVMLWQHLPEKLAIIMSFPRQMLVAHQICSGSVLDPSGSVSVQPAALRVQHVKKIGEPPQACHTKPGMLIAITGLLHQHMSNKRYHDPDLPSFKPSCQLRKTCPAFRPVWPTNGTQSQVVARSPRVGLAAPYLQLRFEDGQALLRSTKWRQSAFLQQFPDC